MKTNQLIPVFNDYPVRVSLFQTILTDNGIESVIFNENMGYIAPYLVTPGGVDCTIIAVYEEDYDRAYLLAMEFDPMKAIARTT
ncbi:MAG: DUF2007 domain-containing protein [Bacteroidales bacterium]